MSVEVCKRIKQSLQKHFIDLEKATKYCLVDLSRHLYTEDLVSVAVRDAPTCSKILDELQAGLEQMKYFTPLRMRYSKFLECLSAQGGPSKGVSDQLREEWEEIKHKYEEQEGSRGGERIKTDLVTNKQLIVLLKKQDDKIETIEACLKEKEEVTERLNTELKETQEEKRLLQKKKNQELEQLETDRMKEMEEEIHVLTLQLNAHRRECEKQEGLVAQNQVKHKTEIQVLNEKLTNEQKSKQQLESQLITMKKHLDSISASKESLQKSNQQLVNELNTVKQSDQKLVNKLREQADSLTASRERLLIAYNQEQAMVTDLEQQLQRMREESAAVKRANKVLKDKVLNLKQQLDSQTAKPVISSHPNIPLKIGSWQNTINSAPPTPSADHLTPVPQGDGKAEIVLSKGQQAAPPSHAEQPDSVPDDTPHMSKEEISRLFKWQDQQVKQTLQQVKDSLVKEQKRQELAQKVDEALIIKQPLPRTMLPHTSLKQEPVNQQQQPKKKVKQQQAAADDSDSDIEENTLLEGIDLEIHEMAEEVRRMSRRPETQEVLFDDEDSSLPYDPNLVCPKCRRQYRVGEIQKLKRHMVEFCTGKR